MTTTAELLPDFETATDIEMPEIADVGFPGETTQILPPAPLVEPPPRRTMSAHWFGIGFAAGVLVGGAVIPIMNWMLEQAV